MMDVDKQGEEGRAHYLPLLSWALSCYPAACSWSCHSLAVIYIGQHSCPRWVSSDWLLQHLFVVFCSKNGAFQCQFRVWHLPASAYCNCLHHPVFLSGRTFFYLQVTRWGPPKEEGRSSPTGWSLRTFFYSKATILSFVETILSLLGLSVFHAELFVFHAELSVLLLNCSNAYSGLLDGHGF